MHRVVTNLRMPSEMVSPELRHLVLDHRLGKLHMLIEDTKELGLLSHGEVVEVKDHKPIHAPEAILVRHSTKQAKRKANHPQHSHKSLCYQAADAQTCDKQPPAIALNMFRPWHRTDICVCALEKQRTGEGDRCGRWWVGD